MTCTHKFTLTNEKITLRVIVLNEEDFRDIVNRIICDKNVFEAIVLV